MTQISARLDYVGNLPHAYDSDMIETKPRINRMQQPWTAIFRAGWLSSARCSTAKSKNTNASRVVYQNARGSRFRMGPNSDIVHVIARDYEQ